MLSQLLILFVSGPHTTSTFVPQVFWGMFPRPKNIIIFIGRITTSISSGLRIPCSKEGRQQMFVSVNNKRQHAVFLFKVSKPIRLILSHACGMFT